MNAKIQVGILSAWLMVLPVLQAQPALKQVFKDDFLVGAAVNASQFSGSDQAASRFVARQFDSITPENVLKWENVHPEPGVFDFTQADRYVAFGESHQMAIIGHTLVWHQQTPAWVFHRPDGSDVSAEWLMNCLSNHIFTVVGRYRGRIRGWDVVNEAVGEDGKLRPTPWLRILGPQYLVKAYQWAHEADPHAELYYNDYGIENQPKRDGALTLVRNLLAAHVPLAAVGIQEHVSLNWPAPAQISQTIAAFSSLGVKVNISELDVDVLPPTAAGHSADVGLLLARNPRLNPYPQELPQPVQEELARRYGQLFFVYVQNRKSIERVTFWGVNDGDSWLNNWPVPGRRNYPLLFDRHDQPKPAFSNVIASAEKYGLLQKKGSAYDEVANP